ncbi:zf-TFIIB domain-containing protein [Candidatus Parcubacteria bacterium]|nr:zf-TFIIB domain-containing protein [Candidatus Parcubacteria bacterium]
MTLIIKSNKEVFMPEKPKGNEEEYFARIEFGKLKKMEQERNAKLAVEEKQRLKILHHMRCPKCGMELIEIKYKNILVDKCSECDGIWLDAGEIETTSKLGKIGLDNLFKVFSK